MSKRKRFFNGFIVWFFTEAFLAVLVTISHLAYHYGDSLYMTLHIFVGALAFTLAYYFEGIYHKLDTNSKTFLELKKNFDYYQTEEKPLLQELRSVIQKNYPIEIQKKIDLIQNSQKGTPNLFLQQYFESWKGKINLYPKWRLIFERLIHANKESIVTNKFSLTLKTYLWSLLDIVDVMMEEAKARRVGLVIHSYTNAIPNDWEDDSNPLVGENMEQYSNELVLRMTQLKEDNKNSYKRFVLCSDNLSASGIKTFEEVREQWNKLSPGQKNDYINKLHTNPDEALIARLRPDVKFKSNYTELIYFGFSNGSQIDWEFCFCCGYTNNNLNITASFYDLNNEQLENIVETDNLDNEGEYGTVWHTNPKVEYSYQHFPDKVSSNKIASVIKFSNLTTLAEKWDLASAIWHNEEENNELLEFLNIQLNLKPESLILDCACGTGEHSIYLHNKGYNVTACDYDYDNIEIFRKKITKESKIINIDVADWLSIEQKYSNESFDFVLCLGSSITYYESWKEDIQLDNLSTVDKTETILTKLKALLKPNGKLIIGVSRHYDRRVRGTTIDFIRSHEKTEQSSIYYDMTWRLDFDWEKAIKYWNCEIKSSKGDDFSFSLISHLYDIKDLIKICEKVFPGSNKVRSEDIDKSSYDLYIICSL